jgi:hypothetical protein
MEALRQPLEGLQNGDLEGSWEGVKELEEQIIQVLRQASLLCSALKCS